MFCFQVNLLDGKRSLNVNIFLKQFKATNKEIVDMLRNGESSKFGAERLKGLLKILPDKDEVRTPVEFELYRSKYSAPDNIFVFLKFLEKSRSCLFTACFIFVIAFAVNIFATSLKKIFCLFVFITLKSLPIKGRFCRRRVLSYLHFFFYRLML